LPPNNDPSYRIKGGSSLLINTLAEKVGEKNIFLNQVVTNILSTTNGITIKTKTDEFQANLVVSTLPPFLLTNTIKFNPNLPKTLKKIMESTHTWMGESIKVGLRYKNPFWRAENSSGTIVSNVGPIPEMYDHADAKEEYFSIKGFFNGAYFSVSKEERLEMVLTQLEKYYGPQVRNFVSYEEGVWREQPFTYTPYNQHVLPHQNNGHTIFSKPLLKNRFYLAGSETAEQYPGYMEGAVRSTQRVAKQIVETHFDNIL
jgi:monoamine oxidase